MFRLAPRKLPHECNIFKKYPTLNTPFLYKQSILTLAPKIVYIFLKNSPSEFFPLAKKKKKKCLVDGLLTSIV